MRRRASDHILAIAVVACVFAACVSLPSAQNAAPVAMRIEPVALIRDRTVMVPVTVTIPEGRFVPAETRAGATGMWLKPEDGWYDTLEYPTFPAPETARLPGSGAAVLAYRRTISIRLPVRVGRGVHSALNLNLGLGYHLCDSKSCGPEQIVEAQIRPLMREPDTTEGAFAFRVDPSHVAILLAHEAPTDRALKYRPLPALFPRIAELPPAHPARAAMPADDASARWDVASDGARWTATPERPVAFGVACEDTMPLGWTARVPDSSFAHDASNYFLARKLTGTAPASAASVAVSLNLTTSQRRDLDTVIDHQVRVTLPSVFAPKVGEFGLQAPAVTGEDREVMAGRARLVTHIETYRLAPDGDARFYVRAHWTVAGQSHVGMTLWIRFDGRRFTVERTDANVTLQAHHGEEGIGNLAASPLATGALLNVIAASDGWAYLIENFGGYESDAIVLRRYTADGPVETGVFWATGC